MKIRKRRQFGGRILDRVSIRVVEKPQPDLAKSLLENIRRGFYPAYVRWKHPNPRSGNERYCDLWIVASVELERDLIGLRLAGFTKICRTRLSSINSYQVTEWEVQQLLQEG